MGSPGIAPAELFPRRLAHRALRMVLQQIHIDGMALQFNPDDPTQALPGVVPGEIWFYEDFDRGRGPVVATVLLDGGRARVLVERVERIIRRKHLKEFSAREVGIARRPGLHDIDAIVDLTEVLEVEGEQMRTARQRPALPREHRLGRPPAVIRAFGSSR